MNKKLLAIFVLSAIISFWTGKLVLNQPSDAKQTQHSSAPEGRSSRIPVKLVTNTVLKTNSTVFPNIIYITPKSMNNNLDKIDKATFTLNYVNTSDTELENVQLLLQAPPQSGLNFTNRYGSVLNKTASDLSSQNYVFDLPNIKAKGSKYISIYVTGSHPGRYTIMGRVRAINGSIANVEPLTIEVR
jgi:hypothetical protein